MFSLATPTRRVPPQQVSHSRRDSKQNMKWEMGRKKKWRARQTSCSEGSFSLRIRYPMSSLQGWLSIFSSCSQGRTLTELCEASQEQPGSGWDQLLRKWAANTLWINQRAQEPSQLLLPPQSRLRWKYLVSGFTRDVSNLPGASHQGPQFAIPGGDTHLCPKGGWRLGNSHKSLCLRRHPVLWQPRRSRNSQWCCKLTVHPSASFYFSSSLNWANILLFTYISIFS